jgi:hypothetical protein
MAVMATGGLAIGTGATAQADTTRTGPAVSVSASAAPAPAGSVRWMYPCNLPGEAHPNSVYDGSFNDCSDCLAQASIDRETFHIPYYCTL